MSVCNGAALVRGRCGCSLVTRSNERGVALLTVMMVLLMLTVLGIAAITVSGLENNMAGLQRTMEASAKLRNHAWVPEPTSFSKYFSRRTGVRCRLCCSTTIPLPDRFRTEIRQCWKTN